MPFTFNLMILLKLVPYKYHQSGQNQSNFSQCAKARVTLIGYPLQIFVITEAHVMTFASNDSFRHSEVSFRVTNVW